MLLRIRRAACDRLGGGTGYSGRNSPWPRDGTEGARRADWTRGASDFRQRSNTNAGRDFRTGDDPCKCHNRESSGGINATDRDGRSKRSQRVLPALRHCSNAGIEYYGRRAHWLPDEFDGLRAGRLPFFRLLTNWRSAVDHYLDAGGYFDPVRLAFPTLMPGPTPGYKFLRNSTTCSRSLVRVIAGNESRNGLP